MTMRDNRKAQKRKQLLGMSLSTARNRLLRDLLWEHVVWHRECYRCGQAMTAKNWTLEHKTPWKDISSYLDLDNVAFSHHRCNSLAPLPGNTNGLRARLGT